MDTGSELSRGFFYFLVWSCSSVELTTDVAQSGCGKIRDDQCLNMLTLIVLSVQLLGDVSAEVPEDDPADLHALSGVPHPAERSSGG